MIGDFGLRITTVQCCDRVNAHDTLLPFGLSTKLRFSFWPLRCHHVILTAVICDIRRKTSNSNQCILINQIQASDLTSICQFNNYGHCNSMHSTDGATIGTHDNTNEYCAAPLPYVQVIDNVHECVISCQALHDMVTGGSSPLFRSSSVTLRIITSLLDTLDIIICCNRW